MLAGEQRLEQDLLIDRADHGGDRTAWQAGRDVLDREHLAADFLGELRLIGFDIAEDVIADRRAGEVHDRADLDRKLACPLLALWGAKGVIERQYPVLEIWSERAASVTGKALPCGHFLAEEAPQETLAELLQFL